MLSKTTPNGSSLYSRCQYICLRCQTRCHHNQNALPTYSTLLKPLFAAPTSRLIPAASNFAKRRLTVLATSASHPKSPKDHETSSSVRFVRTTRSIGSPGEGVRRAQDTSQEALLHEPSASPLQQNVSAATTSSTNDCIVGTGPKIKTFSSDSLLRLPGTTKQSIRRISRLDGTQVKVKAIGWTNDSEKILKPRTTKSRRSASESRTFENLSDRLTLEDALHTSQPERILSMARAPSQTAMGPTKSRRGLTNSVNKRNITSKAKKRVAEEIQVETATEVKVEDIKFEAIHKDIPPVPRLAHGLDRVLFNRGIYQFRDLHSRVYNFDPSIEMITPVTEIEFNSLKGFTPSSQDQTLSRIAVENDKKYSGSTSSMTGTLKHLHFLLSKFRPINMDMLSSQVRETLPTTFTKITAAPEAIFLKWKNGTYAIDADKEFEFSNVLSFMGRYMEKLLTVDKEAFERYKKDQPNPITDEELKQDESYHYSSIGNILMRSQLDSYDPRLPGTGMFDLKTRAVMPIRMDSSNLEPVLGYELQDTLGAWASYEREYADMMRSTLIKYSLQARMGRMDGIFVAYHNITRLFGFQYISLNEMDLALHGQINRAVGDSEFLYSVELLNKLLDEATKKFPEQSLRICFETREPTVRSPLHMDVYVEPVTDDEMSAIQNANKAKTEAWERAFFGAKSDPSNIPAAPAATKTEATSTALGVEWPFPADSSEDGFPTTAAADAVSRDSQDTKIDSETSAVDTDAEPEAEADPALAEKEILHLRLKVESTQDGEHVLRPTRLTDPSAWKLTYSLAAEGSAVEASKSYAASRNRRRKLLEVESRSAIGDYFASMLRRHVDRGKEWRKRLDAQDAEEERRRGGVLVWDSEVPVKRQ